MEALHPEKGRKCTDILCTMLFAVFWSGMLYVSISGFVHGDPDRLLYGLDYKFDQCGKDNSAEARGLSTLVQDVPLADGSGSRSIRLGGKDLTDAPLYYVVAPGRPRWKSLYSGVCGSKCPNEDLDGIGFKPSQWVCTGKYYDKRPSLSVSGIPEFKSFTKDGLSDFVSELSSISSDLDEQKDYLQSFFLFKGKKDECADLAENSNSDCTICFPSYPTVRYGSSSFCLPDVGWIAANKDKVKDVLGDRFDLGFVSEAADTLLGSGGAATLRITADAYTALPVILSCLGFAVLLGFVWAYLLRLFVKPMVLATLIGLFLALALGTAMLWTKADEMRSSGLYGVDTDFTRYADVTMGFFAAGLCTFVLYSVCVFCFWHSIFLATGVIVEASKAMAAMPSLLLVPILPAILTFGLIVYFLVATFWIVSAGELKMDGSGVAQIVYDDNLKGALAFHFFGCVWTSVLLNHVGWAIIAMSVVQWYFAKSRPSDLGVAPVLTATKRVLYYHFGSVVFGSLVVAVIKYIRYMMHFVKAYANPEGRCIGRFVKLIWCCIDCCLRCFEKLLEFISRNAYILVAIESESFCASARHGFGYLVSNLSGLAMVQTLGDAFLFLGKCFVGFASAGICALVLTQTPYFSLSTSSIILPCLVVLLGGYLIGSLFMGIFEMAIDTVFMCYCIDEDKQLGYADGALRDFVKANAREKTSETGKGMQTATVVSAPAVKPHVPPEPTA
jgi:hypothetical protein